MAVRRRWFRVEGDSSPIFELSSTGNARRRLEEQLPEGRAQMLLDDSLIVCDRSRDP